MTVDCSTGAHHTRRDYRVIFSANEPDGVVSVLSRYRRGSGVDRYGRPDTEQFSREIWTAASGAPMSHATRCAVIAAVQKLIGGVQ